MFYQLVAGSLASGLDESEPVKKKTTFRGVIRKSILIDNMISEMSKQIRFQQAPTGSFR